MLERVARGDPVDSGPYRHEQARRKKRLAPSGLSRDHINEDVEKGNRAPVVECRRSRSRSHADGVVVNRRKHDRLRPRPDGAQRTLDLEDAATAATELDDRAGLDRESLALGDRRLRLDERSTAYPRETVIGGLRQNLSIQNGPPSSV